MSSDEVLKELIAEMRTFNDRLEAVNKSFESLQIVIVDMQQDIAKFHHEIFSQIDERKEETSRLRERVAKLEGAPR